MQMGTKGTDFPLGNNMQMGTKGTDFPLGNNMQMGTKGTDFPLGNNMQMGTKGTCFSLGNTKKQLPQANAPPPPHPPKQFVSGDTGNQFPWETVGNWRHRE